MNNLEQQKIEGRLFNAVTSGGIDAMWQIARGRGRMAEVAREALELATSPYNDLSIDQAIGLICEKKK